MASTSSNVSYTPGFVAASSLATSQFKIVKLATTAGHVKLASAATDIPLGVLHNAPASGEEAQVATAGAAKVLAEASVSIGDYVASSTTGRAKTTTTANDDVLGIAMDASAAAGDLIRVDIGKFNY